MTDITNTNAESPDANGYSVCERSGLKAYANELVLDGHKHIYVLPMYADKEHPRESQRYKSVNIYSGAIRPEGKDTFISDSVSVEDL